MSTYEISKSSLLSLKAEILRKQQELSKTRGENEVKIRNLKKNAPLDLKNKGVEQRQSQDLTEEEENLLKKSREALEAKSQLYDKLSKGTGPLTEQQADHYRRYLVRFDKKKKSKLPDLPPEYDDNDVDKYPDSEEEIVSNYEPPKNPDEEWVEYVDCLGRTRTCLRKDLAYLKSKDKDLEEIVEAKRRNRSKSRTPEPPPEPEKPPEPELSEENELLSSDMRREILRKQWEKEEEELRNKQNIHYQDILFDEARTHGVGYYGFSKDEEVRAKQQEALKKLREETKQQQKKSQDLKAMREKQLASRVRAAQNRKRARLGLPPLEDEPQQPQPEPEKPPEEKPESDEKQKKLEEKRKKHIRPWDIGKEGVKEHYEYSQEEWVHKKRKERPSEFAPPSTYKREYRSTTKREIDDSKKSLNFSTKKPEASKNPYKPVPIVNEVSDSDEEDSLLSDYKVISEDVDRGRGVEVAPPPTYDYYGPSDSKKSRKGPEMGNVSDSIEAGLKYLREQLEKKQTSSRRENDMFLS